jgi:hypothetical protein
VLKSSKISVLRLGKSFFVVACIIMSTVSCSTVYSLNRVAKRASDTRALKHDVRVDTASREVGSLHSVAWVAFSAVFECSKDCPFSLQEQKTIASLVASQSFTALDRELRRAFSNSQRVLAPVEETVHHSAFQSAHIETDSYRSRVGRWLDKLGLSRAPEVTVTAAGLKGVNPSELGWSGEQGLKVLGDKLGVDAVAVAHLRLSVQTIDDKPQVVVTGPKLWLFSSRVAKSVAVAELRPNWHLEALQNIDSTSLGKVASGFSARLAAELFE